MTTITSQPLNVDVGLYAGDDTTIRVTAVSASGRRVDLTGTYQCEVRTTAAALVGAAEVDPVNAAAGVLAVRFDHDLTGQLAAGDHVWDLEWTDPAGIVTTLAGGTLYTTPDVSRPAAVVAAVS
jgi:hypothetical protein